MPEAPIIIVDDNPMELEFVEECHRRASLPYPLVCFRSAEQLLDYVRRARLGEHRLPALVLSDVRLFPMNGFELVAKLRELVPELRDVVLFTSSDHSEDARRANQLGVELHAKPTGLSNYTRFLVELAARVQP